MKEHIELKLNQIYYSIFRKIKYQRLNNIGGLYDGEFGILLFLFYYSKYTNNQEVISLANSYTEKLLSKIGKDIQTHSFCSGLAGILYLFIFLRNNNFIDIDIEDSELILEDYLTRAMKIDCENQFYDFLHGALGVGLYFINKDKNHQAINDLINFLNELADTDIKNNIIKWKSILDIKGQIGYNISLSHGISSIVIFLSRLIKNNISDNRLLKMLTGAINYILSQENNAKLYGSYFPHYSIDNTQNLQSRLAWCYGDLGVAYSLWLAGQVTNNTKWKNKALDVFSHSATRLSPVQTNIMDAGICHGSSGVAMIYRRIYIETQINEYLEASNYWLRQTLKHSQFHDGLAGYKSYIEDEWICDYSLLTGISGIGLTFISYLTNDQQTWDEIFLLS